MLVNFSVGPCGGKTTGQARLSTFFENLGWKVSTIAVYLCSVCVCVCVCVCACARMCVYCV